MATVDLPASTEQALSRPSTLQRWLEFAGGSEFLALQPLLHGMKLVELLRMSSTTFGLTSGLAKLGMVPSTARRLADELNRLRAVLCGGVRAPPWLLSLLEPQRAAEQKLLDLNPLTLGPPTTLHMLPPRGQQAIPPQPAPPMQSRTGSARPSRPSSGAERRPASARHARPASQPASTRPTRPASARHTRPTSAAPATPTYIWASSVVPSERRGGALRPAPPAPAAVIAPPSAPPSNGFRVRRPLSAQAPPMPRPPAALRPTSARTWTRGGGIGARHGARPSSSRSPYRAVVGVAGGIVGQTLKRPWEYGGGSGSSASGALDTAPNGSRPSAVPSAPASSRPTSAVPSVGILRSRPPSAVASARSGSRPGSARSRSSSPRDRDSAFSQPPTGAIALDEAKPVGIANAAASASERPVGLLGSVLRREAAIAALKTAVQTAPPPPGRERSKLLRTVAYSINELREATVDAIELLAVRPAHAARFYWNGMDLALKMLTDLLWAPLPQTLDPLLCKWFGDWTVVWLAESKRASREVRSMLAADPLCMHVLSTAPSPLSPQVQSMLALFAPNEKMLKRCRRAEKRLLALAADASTEGAGMGGWAKQNAEQRADTLRAVQGHRLGASYSEGGANHAQRRRFDNFEQLLYGRDGVHLKHLEALRERHVDLVSRAAKVVQCSWRLFVALQRMRAQAATAVQQNEAVALRVRTEFARQSSISARIGAPTTALGSPTSISPTGPLIRIESPSAVAGKRSSQKGASTPATTPTGKVAGKGARKESEEGDDKRGSTPGKMSDSAIAETAMKAAMATMAAYDPEKQLDRSFLRSMAMSVEMPEMS